MSQAVVCMAGMPSAAAAAASVAAPATDRTRRRVRGPILGAKWAAAAALSFSHGSNDAQKSMGVIAALLLAAGPKCQRLVTQDPDREGVSEITAARTRAPLP
jgi:phosphate/sulfate permease